MSAVTITARTLGLGLSLAGVACVVKDPDHCANTGDACDPGFVCSKCVSSKENKGCVAEAQSVTDECMAEGGGDVAATAADTGPTGTMGDATVGDDAAASTGPVGCTSSGLDEACTAATPYCIDGTCSACDADFCAANEPDLPYCGPAGRCVECSVDDPASCAEGSFCSALGVCGGCTSADQCATEGCEATEPPSCHGCNFASGECLEGAVFWVDRETCVEGDEFGTFEQPYCEITTALTNIGTFPVFTVRVAAAGGAYAGSVALSDAGEEHVVAIVGERDGASRPWVAGEATALYVTGSANTMFVSDLEFEGGTTAVATCVTNAGLWLDGVVMRNGEVGLYANDCQPLRVRRSEMVGNAALGLDVDGSDFAMENSIVGGNGTAEDAAGGGIQLVATNDWTIAYSTIVDNLRPANVRGNGLACADDSPGLVRNSIVLSPTSASSIDCSVALFDYVASDDDTITGTDNADAVFNPLEFQNTGDHDYRLRLPEAADFADIAHWQEGDPATDIDFDPRPLVVDTLDWPGADIPSE